MEDYFLKLLYFLLSCLALVVGYIWNDLVNRIKCLENDSRKFPFPSIKEDIAQIKTDLQWVKAILKNNI